MEFNLYKCDFSDDFKLLESDKLLSNNIISSLDKIQTEIIFEFEKKQKGKYGISSLGNEIRFNKAIQSQFCNSNHNEVLLKMTEHHRSFSYFFCEQLAKFQNENLYFLILSKDFGEKSRIVDKSFPSIKHINYQISNLLTSFQVKNLKRDVYFIEILSLEGYGFVEQSKNLRKIFKINS